ncbi:MAG: amidohydrolase family protein [Lentisphaeria bacterium]
MKDCHIHLMPLCGPIDPPEIFVEKAAAAEIDGGNLFSLPPASFRPDPERFQHWEYRLGQLLEYTSKTPGFLPFFWVDPTEADAEKQVAGACNAGVCGFKIIPNHFEVKNVLGVLQQIAGLGLPILFHSGILFDHYASGQYTRPLAYESLLNVPKLTFALAHLGWPWCDEYIAIYGKLRAAENNVLHELGLRMFADLTPGTPIVYRKEAMRKLYFTGYRLQKRVLWGSDARANNYNTEGVKRKLAYDRQIMQDLAEEWKTNPDYSDMSCDDQMDDLFELASEQNFYDFNRYTFTNSDQQKD